MEIHLSERARFESTYAEDKIDSTSADACLGNSQEPVSKLEIVEEEEVIAESAKSTSRRASPRDSPRNN